MIVKIKTTKLDDKKIVCSWVYFDGFRKIKTIDLEEDNFLSEALSFDIDYSAIKEKIKGSNLKEDIPDSGVIILCTKRDGGDYVIATNQQTYLLNDEGKTIERLM